MPRGQKVKTSYTKASETPSARSRQRTAHMPTTKMPHGLSPLAAYIEENRETGITVRELIAQFQEYDCDHPKENQGLVANSPNFQIWECGDCGLVHKKMISGAKVDGETNS